MVAATVATVSGAVVPLRITTYVIAVVAVIAGAAMTLHDQW